jgi:hypothetical protein
MLITYHLIFCEDQREKIDSLLGRFNREIIFFHSHNVNDIISYDYIVDILDDEILYLVLACKIDFIQNIY